MDLETIICLPIVLIGKFPFAAFMVLLFVFIYTELKKEEREKNEPRY
jgi:hypothetical protein